MKQPRKDADTYKRTPAGRSYASRRVRWIAGDVASGIAIGGR
jgi:hypothetical protein